MAWLNLQRAAVSPPEELTGLTARVTADPIGQKRLITCLSPLLAHTGVPEAQAYSQQGQTLPTWVVKRTGAVTTAQGQRSACDMGGL